MKKKILLLVVFMMIGAIAVVAQEQPDRLREKAGEQRTVSVTAQAVLNETRLQACREFLQAKDSNPNATCVGLLTRQINCYEYMKGKGIADPFTACNNLFRGAWSVTKERAFLARAVSAQATEVRLKNLDRLVEKHPNAAGFIKNLTAQEAQKFLYLPGGMQQRILGLNHTQIENALAKLNVRQVAWGTLFKKREIAKDKIEKATEDYERAQKNFTLSDSRYKARLAEFNLLKNRIKGCRGNKTGVCATLEKNATERARQVVVNAAQMAISQLEKIKAKAQAAEDLDENKSKEIVATLDTAIAKLKASIEKAKASQTKEEIKAVAKEVSDIWKSIRPIEKMHAAWLVHASVWNIIQRSEHLETQLDDTLSQMEDNGIKVDGIQAKVDNFSQKIESARLKYNNATTLLKQAYQLKKSNMTAAERTSMEKLVNQSRPYLLQAHNLVKEAHTILVGIVRDIKAAGGQLEVGEQNTGVVVEED